MTSQEFPMYPKNGDINMPLESSITNRILKYLNNEVENCIAEKVAGNAFQKDRPDINGCWKERCFRIEVKSPDHGNKPTKGNLS